MSRTYRKAVKQGMCAGSNTKFYRDMNRRCRNKNRHSLRNLVANYDIDTVSNLIPLPEIPIHDSWNEPTDGTVLITMKDKLYYCNDDYYGEDYWNLKFGKYLKTKNNGRIKFV